MKGPEMIVKVKAIYSNGALTPLEPLNLEEGQEVMVSIEDIPSPNRAIEGLRASAGGWKGGRDPEELKRMIYEARITGSREPVDL